MTSADPARPGFQDAPANYAFRRVVDSAEDLSDSKLEHAVLAEISALDPAQREALIVALAGTISRLFARQRPSRTGRRDTQVVNRAVGGIVAAARQYGDDLAGFHRACQTLTDPLSRQQLARVTAALGAELSVCGSDAPGRAEKKLSRKPAK